MGVPQKLKVELLHNPAIPFLVVYPEERKSVSALFTITMTCNQPKCPSVNKWI
jgi:hypothetical protein